MTAAFNSLLRPAVLIQGLFVAFLLWTTTSTAEQESTPRKSVTFEEEMDAQRALFSTAPAVLSEVARLREHMPKRSTGAAKYKRSGHEYTTYIVATLAGLDPERAHILSYFSQYPDDEIRFSATMAFFYLWDLEYRKQIMAVLHSLHGGDRKAVTQRRMALRNLLAENIRNGKLSDPELGLIIHAFADSYAHVNSDNLQAFDYAFGHLFHGDSPDIISHDQSRYEEYACKLFNALSERPNLDCAASLKQLFNLISSLSASGDDELPEFKTYAKQLGFNALLYDNLGQRFDNESGKKHVLHAIHAIENAIDLTPIED